MIIVQNVDFESRPYTTDVASIMLKANASELDTLCHLKNDYSYLGMARDQLTMEKH